MIARNKYSSTKVLSGTNRDKKKQDLMLSPSRKLSDSSKESKENGYKNMNFGKE